MEAAGNCMISFDNISKTYARGESAVHALRGVSFSIEAGEYVAIMGPSGSGKSTLMHILGLLDTPDGGSYSLLGRDVTSLTDDALAHLRNTRIGFVFQHFNLLARTTAMENVALPMLYSSGKVDLMKTRRALNQVGLGDRLRHKPNELSGGQQQRVAIARALIHNPPIILADEPTGNLDSKSTDDILDLLSELNASGITVIIVTHETNVAERARRIIRMHDGMIKSDERTALRHPAPASGAFAPSMNTVAGNAPAERSTSLAAEIPSHFKHAWRALAANKVRTFLSTLGILIGVAAVIAMMAIGTGARRSIEQQLSSLGSNLLVVRPGAQRTAGVALQAGSVTRFTLRDADAIREEVPQARFVSATVSGRGQVVFGNRNWNTQIAGASPEYEEIQNSHPIAGRFFTEDDVKTRARVAVIGLTLVRELFGDANPLGEYIKINRVIFRVVGVLPEKGASGWRDQDDIVVIPVTTAMYRLLGREYVDSIEIEAVSASSMDAAQEAIRSVIIRNHRLPPAREESFNIRNMSEILEALTSTSRTMAWLLFSIAAISLLVGGIGIMNIMLVSVTERTREIGTRKAVGARRRDILAQFLTEALVISLAGGVVGILLGSGISLAISRLAEWTVVITLESILISCGFSILVGVVFGIWPARKAAVMNPIDALRYE